LALAATHLERAVLFGVRPLDAPSLLAALAVLAFALAAAAWIPARRAASIEPMLALRNE
jgi:ABC-type lipoprotein release transport system permease subunit